MRLTRLSASSVVAVAAAALLPALAVAPTAEAATSGVTAFYEMNEAPGATVMHDSSGNGLDGTIDPTGVQSGATFDGATGYNWVRRNPTDPPASPERVIQVPDNINLEPGTTPDFTLEIRYRTKEKFGNIIQKGQATTVGGQWKIQNPKGIPSCLFTGSLRRVATGSLTPLNDNQWHTLTCVLTSQGVSMYVDGVFRNKKNGNIGTLDNKYPMTIGGKINCDQILVTCDYFSGQIDYVKITKGAVPPPPPPPGSVSFIGSASAQSGAKTVSVKLPATAAGQQMVMVLSRANAASALADPAGWTQLTSGAQGSSLYTTAWTRTATAADVGATVKVTLSAAAKMTLTASAYAGAGPPAPYAVGTDGVNHTARVTPTVSASSGSWLVSYWADKSSNTTSWSVSGASSRSAACGTGGGHVCSALADSNGTVPAGPSGGVTASTDASSSSAVMWSFVMSPVT